MANAPRGAMPCSVCCAVTLCVVLCRARRPTPSRRRRRWRTTPQLHMTSASRTCHRPESPTSHHMSRSALLLVSFFLSLLCFLCTSASVPLCMTCVCFADRAAGAPHSGYRVAGGLWISTRNRASSRECVRWSRPLSLARGSMEHRSRSRTTPIRDTDSRSRCGYPLVSRHTADFVGRVSAELGCTRRSAS